MAVSSATHGYIREKEEREKAQSVNKRNVLYHYTSLSGLLGIIENKCIWASDIRYLNDSNEFSYTIELASELFKAKEHQDFSDLSKNILFEQILQIRIV